MFFNTDNLSFEITTVLGLEWNSQNGLSGLREHHAISYRIEGGSEFVHGKNSVYVRTGEIAFVPANYEYRQVSAHEKLIVVHFTSDSVLPEEIKCFRPENTQYFERKFTELLDIWSKKQAGYNYECKSVLYKILAKIEYEIAELKLSGANDKISEAVEYIHEHFTDSTLTVEALAHMCGMSDTCFRKYFVSLFSVTPVRYINNLKLNYAKELIRSGYCTVNEISERCGFSTVNYFSAFIKKETGKCPSQLKL